MSSHNIYIKCQACGKTEAVYTGDVNSYEFDDSDREGKFIELALCLECKELTNLGGNNELAI